MSSNFMRTETWPDDGHNQTHYTVRAPTLPQYHHPVMTLASWFLSRFRSGFKSLRDASHRFLSQIFNAINQFEETESKFYSADPGHVRILERTITSFARVRYSIHGRLVNGRRIRTLARWSARAILRALDCTSEFPRASLRARVPAPSGRESRARREISR